MTILVENKGVKLFPNLNMSYNRDKGYVVLVTYEQDGTFAQPLYAKRGNEAEAVDYIAECSEGSVSNIRFWETKSLTLDEYTFFQLSEETEGIDVDAFEEMEQLF